MKEIRIKPKGIGQAVFGVIVLLSIVVFFDIIIILYPETVSNSLINVVFTIGLNLFGIPFSFSVINICHTIKYDRDGIQFCYLFPYRNYQLKWSEIVFAHQSDDKKGLLFITLADLKHHKSKKKYLFICLKDKKDIALNDYQNSELLLQFSADMMRERYPFLADKNVRSLWLWILTVMLDDYPVSTIHSLFFGLYESEENYRVYLRGFENAVPDYDEVDWDKTDYCNVTEDLAFEAGIPWQEFSVQFGEWLNRIFCTPEIQDTWIAQAQSVDYGFDDGDVVHLR